MDVQKVEGESKYYCSAKQYAEPGILTKVSGLYI